MAIELMGDMFGDGVLWRIVHHVLYILVDWSLIFLHGYSVGCFVGSSCILHLLAHRVFA